MEKMYYFAYGSNLHPLRLQRRVPSAELIGFSQLSGYQLRFHAEGMDQSGKCNLLKTGASLDVVYGVVYSMAVDEQPALDACEGPAYGVDTLTLTIRDRQYECLVYLARDPHIDEQLEPYDWYKEIVMLGAQYQQFPNHYVNVISSIPCKEDGLHDRVVSHRQLIQDLRRANQSKLAHDKDDRRVGIDTVRDYCDRIGSILAEAYGVPKDADLVEKLQLAGKHFDQYCIDRLRELRFYHDQAINHARADIDGAEFTKIYDDVIGYLLTRAEQIKEPPQRMALSKLAYRAAESLGTLAGVTAMFAAIVAGTYFGYKYFDYGGAFFAFLVVFIISGLLIKPVLLLFKWLGMLVAVVVEQALRHYGISSAILIILMIAGYFYGQQWGFAAFISRFAVAGL